MSTNAANPLSDLHINFKRYLMKSITKSIFVSAAALMAFSFDAAAQCANYTYYPVNQAIGWESSDNYEVINLDAATLTDASLYPRTGATDGKSDNLNYTGGPDNTLKAPTGTGVITLPLMDFEAGTGYVPSGYNYDINFVRCVFAPDHYGSALTKDDWGELPSGKDDACTINDNTCLIGNVYGKQGFIELSRQIAPEGQEVNALCGYIQLDNLHGVEKIQWSYSSTSWKRGVICEVRYGGEGEEWLPNRIIPSDVNAYATFSEQGYEFEELINADDPDVYDVPVSVRFRIFDCDTITFAHEKDLDPSERSPAYYYKPTSSLQSVRIHQIKVFSALKGSEMAAYMDPTGIKDQSANTFTIEKLGNTIMTSTECNIEIYDVQGQLIKKTKGNSIGTWEFSRGLYIVKATTIDGKETQNVKMPIGY